MAAAIFAEISGSCSAGYTNSPAALLTVRVGGELGGYAWCGTISFGDPARFADLLGEVQAATMEQVDMALRAALSL